MTDSDMSTEEVGSRVEAAIAEVHSLRHPADPNDLVVRGRLTRGALIAGLLAAAVTVAGVVLLALAVGGR